MKKYNLNFKLIYLRKSKRYTQSEVAEILNISRSNLSRYEQGIRVPSIEILTKLANLYDVSCDYLLNVDS